MADAPKAPDEAWIDLLAAELLAAPAWMRALASAELHIGGFTNVRLDHPVLDASAAPDDATARRALLFFAAASLVHGASIARVQCGPGTPARELARLARTALRGSLLRVDDESLALVGYFDLYLKPAAAIAPATGRRLLRAVREAIADPTGPSAA